jgi:hypothetical protein
MSGGNSQSCTLWCLTSSRGAIEPPSEPTPTIPVVLRVALQSIRPVPSSNEGRTSLDRAQPFSALSVGSWPEAVAIGDVTGDGRRDVVMTTSYASDPASDYRLWVLAQTADGSFAAPVSYATAASYTQRPESVAIGDITGDGAADVVVGLARLGVQVFPQLAGGSLGAPTLTATGDASKIRLGHLDGDQKLDVAGVGWGTNTLSVLLNDGTGGLICSEGESRPLLSVVAVTAPGGGPPAPLGRSGRRDTWPATPPASSEPFGLPPSRPLHERGAELE